MDQTIVAGNRFHLGHQPRRESNARPCCLAKPRRAPFAEIVLALAS